MEWDIFNIFKKADFISFMLSLAISAWLLFYIGSDNIVILIVLGLALLSSSYVVIRFIVYCYQKIQDRIKLNKARNEKELKRKQDREREEIEITRMFYGLSDENKRLLSYIILKGEKDKYSDNILLFPKYSEESSRISQAQYISQIFRDNMGYGQECITTKLYTDSIAAIIDPVLFTLIRQYIDEKGLELKK